MNEYLYCFVIDIENKLEDYATASLFISKLINGEELFEDDIINIKYFRLFNFNVINIKKIIEEFNTQPLFSISDLKSFNSMIHNLKYVIIYNIKYTNESDITELRNFVLVKDFFKNIAIYAHILGTSNDYYKISHYLMLFSTHESFYNSVYYNNGMNIKRLQKRGIGVLKDFLPLIPIHKEDNFLNVFFEETTDNVNLINEQMILKKSCFKLIDDFVSKIKRKNNITDLISDDIFCVLDNARLIELCLFCFLLSQETQININKKSSLLDFLKKYYLIIKKYSSCIRQIIENVLFHSALNKGVLSLRIFKLKKHEIYLKNKYGESYFQIGKDTYLEITISDYSGNICNGNISEHFIRSLPNKYRNSFEGLKLKDFFKCETDKYKQAWTKYYVEDDNIGKHYGLKIFNSLILNAYGIFFIETHSSHIPNKYDYYCSENYLDLSTKKSMPGTSYSILLPMYDFDENSNNISDISITSDVRTQWNEYLKYSSKEIELFNKINKHYTTNEKSKNISKIVSYLKSEIENITNNIIFQVNVADKNEYHTELVCKAIILLAAMEKEENIPHIAFYNCEEIYINSFINIFQIFWDKAQNAISSKFQIALIPKTISNYTVIIPESANLTAIINKYISTTRANENNYIDYVNYNYNVEIDKIAIIPFEVLVMPNDYKNMTLFEIYTQDILKSNVQEYPLGCKIEDTHMRLGSSIHIDDFYEAELLFGNKMFVSCFAYLLTKDILNMNITNDIVLFGYASYSEMLIYNTKKLIESTDLGKRVNVESLLLERESDNRGIGHIDLLRKSHSNIFNNKSTVIYIVPINSTLKTLGKMYDKIEENYKIDNKDCTAFTLITISPTLENDYWKFDDMERKIIPKNNLSNVFNKISYYITAETTYHEAIWCKMCFPDKPIHEKPLIEVNASSTIPNQSFQLINKIYNNTNIGDELKKQLILMSDLKETLLYGHTFRGENHFLYYIKTEKLFNKYESQIENWLKSVKENTVFSKDNYIDTNIFNIIFCPMHFSNVNFVEMVNDVVFDGAAMIIRVDVDKEYRSNFKAKFSNVTTLVENLRKKGEKFLVRIHYIDDTIITGRTYHRSKNIITSLFSKGNVVPNTSALDNIKIFYSIILLLNRNSSDSLAEYEEHFTNNEKSQIFIFFNLKISSLRTHGNSCVLCNLKRDSEILCTCASTQEMENYWKNKLTNSFTEIKINELQNIPSERAVLRLTCTHLSGLFLPSLGAHISRESAMLAIIKLISLHLDINTSLDKDMQMSSKEIFYSYIKVISRPFISFDKFIKEAVFDMLLILIEALLDNGKKDISEYISIMENDNDNKYIKKYDISISEKFKSMLKKAEIDLSTYNEDLLKILMKQLTELKSNYIIRVDCTNKIVNYVNKNVDNENILTTKKLLFINFYARLVKRLVGTGSDTSKSVWLDYILLYGNEYGKDTMLIDNEIMKRLTNILMVENTRVYFDAIEHLSRIKELKFDYGSVQTTLKGLYNRINLFLQENHTKEEERTFLDMVCGNSLVKTILDNVRSLFKIFSPKDALEYLNTRFGNTYSDIYSVDSDMLFNTDLTLLIAHIQGGDYIYENFRKVLKNIYKFNDMSRNDNFDCQHILETDKQLQKLIMSSVHCLKYIDHFDDKSEDADTMVVPHRYKKFAIIVRELLAANNVSIIIQNNVSLNAWIDKLNTKAKEKGLPFKDSIPFQGNEYEYIILSSSNTLEYEDDEYCPNNLSHNIQKYIENDNNEFYIGNDVFIWKIDSESRHPIFIYADFDSENKIRMVNVKCLMMMRSKLKKNVFGTDKNAYIHELVQERNELIIQKRNKSHTHTNNSALSNYYIMALKNKNDENLAIVMILLADLAVSETYRQSLSSDFYLYDIDFSFILWKESLFKTVKNFVYSDSERINVVIDNLPEWHKKLFYYDCIIHDDDKLITLTTAINEQKPVYFLLAMAQNALKVASNNKDCKNKNYAEVYITKTAVNNIRICNLINPNDADEYKRRIERSILNPPVTGDQGITMWSISRFVKALTILTASKYIDKTDSESYDLDFLKRLFSDEFSINVTCCTKDDLCCLSIEVPLIWDKYDPFFK